MKLEDLKQLRADLRRVRRGPQQKTRITIKLNKVSEQLNITPRWVRHYWLREKELDERISKEELRQQTVKLLLECARLFSCPVATLLELMAPAIPGLDTKPKIKSKKTSYSKSKVGYSKRTYYTKINQLFSDLSPKTIKTSLRHWESGTFAIHSFPIRWKKRHSVEGSHLKAGRPSTANISNTLLLVADRGNPFLSRVGFQLLEEGETEEKKVKKIKTLLKRVSGDLKTVKTVRLVSKIEDGKIIADAIDEEVLRRELSKVEISVDHPTVCDGTYSLDGSYVSSSEVKKKFSDFFSKIIS